MNTAVDRARWDVPAEDEEVQSEYLQALRLIERLHRLLLDVIKDEFDRQGGSISIAYRLSFFTTSARPN